MSTENASSGNTAKSKRPMTEAQKQALARTQERNRQRALAAENTVGDQEEPVDAVNARLEVVLNLNLQLTERSAELRGPQSQVLRNGSLKENGEEPVNAYEVFAKASSDPKKNQHVGLVRRNLKEVFSLLIGSNAQQRTLMVDGRKRANALMGNHLTKIADQVRNLVAPQNIWFHQQVQADIDAVEVTPLNEIIQVNSWLSLNPGSAEIEDTYLGVINITILVPKVVDVQSLVTEYLQRVLKEGQSLTVLLSHTITTDAEAADSSVLEAKQALLQSGNMNVFSHAQLLGNPEGYMFVPDDQGLMEDCLVPNNGLLYVSMIRPSVPSSKEKEKKHRSK